MIQIIVILIVQGAFLQGAFLHASFMDSIGDVVKSTLSDNDDNKMPEIQADMIDLEKGEIWGLPSVFGLNKKKQKKVFGSTILGDTKDATIGFYRGFNRTGESTEFMSGVMYKSSKMYNGMFEIFDDSPLNIFDDKDEREPSVFDKGNDVLDIFK